ncbi:hypothetical protein PILCRDRAFT_819568 [Piloderma croceum F 1598]|uniref:Uncharacterized protein n=1 Tax=Piloderma croceum (strain F 1598) TaxID=765440 RepID=A0A0C3FV39_PILCF|nr:hypothetical protein PILCRDRAFT_819568 [Piloderma croceum F 1598]
MCLQTACNQNAEQVEKAPTWPKYCSSRRYGEFVYLELMRVKHLVYSRPRRHLTWGRRNVWQALGDVSTIVSHLRRLGVKVRRLRVKRSFSAV